MILNDLFAWRQGSHGLIGKEFMAWHGLLLSTITIISHGCGISELRGYFF